jgi:glycosyltransferase 2 family protein
MARGLRSRPVQIASALVLLAALYAAADWRAVGRAIAGLDAACLIAALALFVPQTLLSAWRWRRWIGPVSKITLAAAVRQTLASSALNLVVPSKLGDLSKAAMLPKLSAAGRARASLFVAAEKGADVVVLAGVLLWGAGGLPVWGLVTLLFVVVLTGRGLSRIADGSARMASHSLSLAAATLALWGLHLAQFDLFLKAAGVFVPVATVLARVPTAIFAGLLPVSFCGVGPRDAALIWLFADVADTPTMAAVGLLTALRYLVPGAAGIPLLANACRGSREESSAPTA